MKLGISLYPGLSLDREESTRLLREAASLGFSRVFSSLSVPESNPKVLRDDAAYLFSMAENLGMEIIADISPAAQDLLQIHEITPQILQELHITTARIDFGLSPEAIAGFSHEINIQLNASTLRSQQLAALLKANADFSRIEGQHNFYPRPHTGLSAETIQRQNALLHRHDLLTGAFISSREGRRGPLYAGLPTMESLRNIMPADAAPILTALGCDTLIIGDSRPSYTELRLLSDPETLFKADARYSRKALPPKREWQPDTYLPLPIRILTDIPEIRQLLSHSFTNRPDPAADCIRAQESRILAQSLDIQPEQNEKKLMIENAGKSTDVFSGPQTLHSGNFSDLLPIGTVILDNNSYGRYKGELQILTVAQNRDPRSNVVAQIKKEGLPLLSLISAGTPFRFIYE